MKTSMIVACLSILLLLAAGCQLPNIFYGQPGDSNPDNNPNSLNSDGLNVSYDKFAQCLTENGAIMFGTEWCSHCKDQKAMFGDSFQYINYADCDVNRQLCQLNGIKGYPTWKIDSDYYPGTRTLAQLAQLSGCNITG